jgi:actin-related protein 5
MWPGSSAVRAGWSFETAPRVVAPPLMSKFRDRKMGKTYTLAGADCYYDATSRSHAKSAFEPGTGIVTNWDAMEQVLDYSFVKLGLGGAAEGGRVDVPVVMTEPVANLPYARKSGLSSVQRGLFVSPHADALQP